MTKAMELAALELAQLGDARRAGIKTLITPVHNVVGYDAKGDGVADDTQAIQTAIDTASLFGGVVYFPAGTYLISSPLILKHRVNLQGAGVSFLEGADLSAPHRSTIKLKDGANCDLMRNDPAGPVRGGQDVAHTWQRSHITGLVLDGNATNQTVGGLAGLNCFRVWGVTLSNCEIDNVRGINIYLNDVNAVTLTDVTSIGGASTTSCIYLKDSADCILVAVQAGGAGGPVLVLDNSIKNTISASLFYNAVSAGIGDEYAVYLKNNSKWNTLKGIRADQAYLDGVYIDATCRDNDIEVIALENGFNNAAGRSGIRVAGTHNRISGIASKGSNLNQRQHYGVTVDANADHNRISVKAADNLVGEYNVSTIGTANVTTSPITSTMYMQTSDLEAIIGTPTIGTVGGGRRPAFLMDATLDEMIGSAMIVPQEWSKIQVVVQWVNAGAGVGNVYWSISGMGFSAGNTVAISDQLVWDGVVAAGAQDILSESGAGPIYAVTPGQLFYVRVKRVASDVQDTLPNDVGVLGVKILRG